MNRVPADVERTLAYLDSLQRSLAFIAAHLADVHLLAYEKPVGERSGGGASGIGRPTESTLTGGGDKDAAKLGAAARTVCGTLGVSSGRGLAQRSAIDWGTVESEIQSIIGGPGAGPLRGTLIGAEEYKAAIDAQKRRAMRGADPATEHLAEYEPQRSRGQTQPAYPAPKSRAKAKTDPTTKPKRGWHT